MNEDIHILIVEDAIADAELIERELFRAGISFASARVDTKEAFKSALSTFRPDLILSDYNLPQFSGLDALRLLKASDVLAPFILVTGSLTEEVAVECMKQGAQDYILKTSLTRLPSAVLNALERAKSDRQRREAEQALHESEERLRQAQKLEAVGQLAGGVAHDFNNLLTVILGYCDLLLKDKSETDSNRQMVEEIRQASDRASTLTRQLLAFSRRQVLQPEVFDLNNLVENMTKMLRRVIGENIRLINALETDVSPICADHGQIEQVLMNLVVNARDALSQGGIIRIETANVNINQLNRGMCLEIQDGPYVMLSVSDNGEGMDSVTAQHIFEPFFTTKAQGKGTGLGLSTVYGIIKQSGGNISLVTEPGQGTSFRIYLPTSTVAARVDSSPDEQVGTSNGSETILLVEDEPQIRRLTTEFLKRSGYRVLTSSNGREALDLLERFEEPIHLIVTDVVMPEMNGTELAVRAAIVKPDARVIYMSGYTDDAIVQHGIGERTAFIQKPFTAQSLACKVREVLDSDSQKAKLDVDSAQDLQAISKPMKIPHSTSRRV